VLIAGEVGRGLRESDALTENNKQAQRQQDHRDPDAMKNGFHGVASFGRE
jgi:hypothetical protein